MQRADVLRLNRAWVDAGRGKPRPYTKFWNNLDTSLSREGSVEAGAPPGQPAGYAIYPITLQGRIRHHFLFQPGKPVIVAIGSAAGQFGQKTEGKTWYSGALFSGEFLRSGCALRFSFAKIFRVYAKGSAILRVSEIAMICSGQTAAGHAD